MVLGLLVVVNPYMFLMSGSSLVLTQPQKCELWLVIFRTGEHYVLVGS